MRPTESTWVRLTPHNEPCSPRSGSRTAEQSGVGKKRWTPAPWSSTIRRCCPSTGQDRFTAAWVPWPTPSPWTPGCPLLCPAAPRCTASPASWVRLRACSPATPATASSTLPLTLILTPTLTLTLTLTPIRPWDRGCKAWPRRPTTVLRRIPRNTPWRTWTSAAPASPRCEWRPRNTSSLWIRPGTPCDTGTPSLYPPGERVTDTKWRSSNTSVSHKAEGNWFLPETMRIFIYIWTRNLWTFVKYVFISRTRSWQVNCAVMLNF